ncbi:MAG: restriction endonuclease subunit S [Verrucomicrobiia bacterium]
MNVWKQLAVADLLADNKLVIGDGYRAKNEELSSTGLPFARAGNINCGFQFKEADHFPEANLQRVGNKVSQPGDVVFTSKGTVGRFALVRENTQRFVYSPQLCFWRATDGSTIDSRFLYFWMYGREFFLQYKGVAGQTDMAEYVSLGDQRRMYITLPDISEQRAIASVLGSLDDKIELNRRMNETLEALAQSLFKSWFVDATQSALPKGWRETVLSECCENIFSGGTPSTQAADYWGGDIPWLSSGETRSRFIIDTEKTITPLGVENSSTRPARTGSTVIASAGQGHTRGQTSFLTFDSYINQSVVVLVADKSVLSDLFLFFDLARRYEQFRQMSDSQSSRGSLTTKLLAEMKVVVPPRALISKFDDTVAPMTKKIIANLHESRTLAALRDALLPKLLSGELRVGNNTKQP